MISESLLNLVKISDPTPNEVVEILDRVSRYWLNGDRSVQDDIEAVIRLLERADELDNIVPGVKRVLEALSREAGLYPYLGNQLTLKDQLAKEVHSVPGIDGLVFHTEQMRVFSRLLQGRNVVLSAPTSFGKTLLVDALIASKKPKYVIIAVPTISLLEERRRALTKRFPQYQIVTQSFQKIEHSRVIVVGTQERILEREDEFVPDLFVIDEFYKLDLSGNDSRARSLNLLLAKYIDISKQVYLLGPSIESNPVNPTTRSNFEFIRTSYSPVAADVISIDPPGTEPAKLCSLLSSLSGTASLVYCRSPKSARDVTHELIDRKVSSGSDRLRSLATWIRDNYHSDWYLADALSHGIGIHHGRVPRAISQLMVQLFNARELDILLCTSSLIEGVNTVAENVIIYDKFISTRKLDRFTFDNIKGRAGRMFHHFVGKVFLFNEAPAPLYETLEIPLLQEPGLISDADLVQLPDHRLSDVNKKRKAQIFDRVAIPADLLERYAKFGIQEVEGLFSDLDDLLRGGDTSLIWTGPGRYKEVLSSMEVVWGRVPFEKHSLKSARQFAWFANKLQRSSSIKMFLETICGSEVDEDIERGLNFLKGAEYSFVDPLSMVQDMVNELSADRYRADYSQFIGTLSSWGLPGYARALEEIGVPAPLSQKLQHRVNLFDFDEAVAGIRGLANNGRGLTPVENVILNLTVSS